MDPPYQFNSPLKMKDGIARSAESQYKSVLTLKDIINIDVKNIAAKDALLALWVPSAMLFEGLIAMENYGFYFKQTYIWVKTKQSPFKKLLSAFLKDPIKALSEFDLNSILSFNMGHCFRNTHEICLIGTRGRILSYIQNHSQRTVCISEIEPVDDRLAHDDDLVFDDGLIFDESMIHSKKTEKLQDSLDLMFPNVCKDKKGNVLEINRLEMFARRQREGYLCIGNECPGIYFGKDIRDVLKELAEIK